MSLKVPKSKAFVQDCGIIRLAHPADALVALALEGEATELSSLRAREILEGAIAAKECFVDVDSNDEITGLVIRNTRAFFGRDFVKLLIVSGAHRRAGVATSLLRNVLSGAHTDTIFSSTNESNLPMRSLFEKEGWTLSGKLTGIDEGDPELVFWHRRVST
jgi:hypothetical protein